MGLILDSSMVIAAERRGDTPEQLVQQVIGVPGHQEAALSSVGLTELVHGCPPQKMQSASGLVVLNCSEITIRQSPHFKSAEGYVQENTAHWVGSNFCEGQ